MCINVTTAALLYEHANVNNDMYILLPAQWKHLLLIDACMNPSSKTSHYSSLAMSYFSKTPF